MEMGEVKVTFTKGGVEVLKGLEISITQSRDNSLIDFIRTVRASLFEFSSSIFEESYSITFNKPYSISSVVPSVFMSILASNQNDSLKDTSARGTCIRQSSKAINRHVKSIRDGYTDILIIDESGYGQVRDETILSLINSVHSLILILFKREPEGVSVQRFNCTNRALEPEALKASPVEARTLPI